MPPPSENFDAPTAAEVLSDKPVNEIFGGKCRKSLIHLKEWLGLDYTGAQNHDHDGVNSKIVTTFTSLTLSAVAPATPVANTLYKDNIIKGWISLNGTGTIAIREEFNVTSITDNGIGSYIVVWDRNFDVAQYCTLVTSGTDAGVVGNVTVIATSSIEILLGSDQTVVNVLAISNSVS